MKIDYTKLGNRIKEERLKRNLSREELAEIIDISPSFLGLIERAERGLSIDTLYSIASAYGATIDSLMNENKNPNFEAADIFKSLTHNLNKEEIAFVVEVVKTLKNNIKKISQR